MQSVIKLTVFILIIIPLGLLSYNTFKPKTDEIPSPFSKTNLQINPSPNPTPNPQTFILLGDTGAGNQAQIDVANAVNSLCKLSNCEAAFIAGDVIYDNGVSTIDDPQFNTKFEAPYKNLNIPFYIAFGNHDYIGCAQCYLDYAQKSSKWNMPSNYYVQRFEGIEFFIIDTENFDISQQNWLSSALKESNIAHKIVIGHRPIKTNEEAYINEKWNGKEELQEIICNSANFYVAGHAHLLELTEVDGCQVTQIVSGGGGHSTRFITQPNDSIFFHEGNGFATIILNREQLSISFIDNLGVTLYRN